MNDADIALARLRGRPLAFLFRYIKLHPLGHLVVTISILLAVVCSVSTQFGMKYLIDVVSMGREAGAPKVWGAFGFLCALVAADNLLWRVGGYMAHRTFVAVTGDIRRDMFAYLAGHSPGFFASRLPGGLASRVSSSANSAFTVLNTSVWNVIPPLVAVGLAISFIGSVHLKLAGGLLALALLLGAVVFTLARRGTPLHRVHAEQAAGVDGELVDVISNFSVMRAFGATAREQARLAGTIGVEMASRRRSLYYMEHLRLIHAVLTALLTAGVVGAGVMLWLDGQATVGDLVLLTSLAFTILHGTRDLAVSLVDLTQYLARLEEAIGALLLPQELPDAPRAIALPSGPRHVTFEDVSFSYPGRTPVLENFNLTLAGSAGRAGRLFRCGQIHGTIAVATFPRRERRPDRDRWSRYPRHNENQPARYSGFGAARYFPAPSHRAGKPLLWPSRRDGRPDARRRRDRPVPGVHRGVASRFRHDGGRSRGHAVRRATPAAGDRACPVEGCADPAAGRGDQRAGYRVGTTDPGGAGRVNEGPHGHRDRASAFDVAPVRPHCRDGSRSYYR